TRTVGVWRRRDLAGPRPLAVLALALSRLAHRAAGSADSGTGRGAPPVRGAGEPGGHRRLRTAVCAAARGAWRWLVHHRAGRHAKRRARPAGWRHAARAGLRERRPRGWTGPGCAALVPHTDRLAW